MGPRRHAFPVRTAWESASQQLLLRIMSECTQERSLSRASSQVARKPSSRKASNTRTWGRRTITTPICSKVVARPSCSRASTREPWGVSGSLYLRTSMTRARRTISLLLRSLRRSRVLIRMTRARRLTICSISSRRSGRSEHRGLIKRTYYSLRMRRIRSYSLPWMRIVHPIRTWRPSTRKILNSNILPRLSRQSIQWIKIHQCTWMTILWSLKKINSMNMTKWKRSYMN